MGKMILFAGKEIPAGNDIASGATFQGRRVIATSLNVSDEAEPKQEGSANVIQVAWNRGSPLSCRSLALKCENEGGVDEAALFFDEFYFATRFRAVTNNAQILEEHARDQDLFDTVPVSNSGAAFPLSATYRA